MRRSRKFALVAVMLLGAVTVGVYVVVGIAANLQPVRQSFNGWIALLQRPESLSTAQVFLRAETLMESVSSVEPYVAITVRTCGNSFAGELLLGGDAQLDNPVVTDDQGIESPTPQIADVALSQGDKVWDLGPVQRIPISIGEIDCVPDLNGTIDTVTVGRSVSVSGQLQVPIMDTPATLGVDGPRSIITWPLTGGLPLGDENNRGVFHARGELSGRWAIASTNTEIDLGPVPAAGVIEGASPQTTDASGLRWTGTSPVQPVTRVTDVTVQASLQHYLLITTIVFALVGSVLASILFEWLRKQPQPNCAPAATTPTPDHRPPTPDHQLPMPAHAREEPTPVSLRKRCRALAVVIAAGVIGYLIGRR